ncbi:protein aveugle-like [Tigriopus californicus]|uniref:protein aveugle-like n=1 Tax=Tigriopus californicus TaxID=6832 RepID=UPI0027DA730C|nr:protein aveugle-like [Tigriopus californicus]
MTVKQPRVTTTTTTAASPNSSSVSASRTGSSSSSSSSSVPSHSTVGSRPTEHQAQPGPNTSSPNKIPKPIPASDWSVVEVQNWFRRKCGEYYHLYSEKLLEQGITGPSLLRLNESSLLRLGIFHPEHRQAIWREITKLRLRTNILILRELEREQK